MTPMQFCIQRPTGTITIKTKFTSVIPIFMYFTLFDMYQNMIQVRKLIALGSFNPWKIGQSERELLVIACMYVPPFVV